MSHNHGAGSAPPSRRSVVKGAAWAVPAVVVAGAAPTVAASAGPLEFTGSACKLPGSSTDRFKGYVFELTATNTAGPNPTTAITVITSLKIDDVTVTDFGAFVRSGPTCSGACASQSCGGAPAGKFFCTPDGASQQILIYTGPDVTGSSSNAKMDITYQRYECTGCVPVGPLTPLGSGVRDTPPRTENGGGSCKMTNILPIPSLPPA